MLPTHVHASTELLAESAVRCAWAQWSAIGALTLPVSKEGNEIIDVEALLLGSLGLATRVPRLRTLATDWTLENSQLLSIARLRALLAGPFAGSGVQIGELAQLIATEGGDARWRALAAHSAADDARSDQTRGTKRKAVLPRWRGARTLLLKLRRGFGVGVKPDLLAILLGSRGGWVDAATLAELSGYTVAAVRRAADDMANADLIELSDRHRRTYRANVMAWTSLFPALEASRWVRRADGFAFALRWMRCINERNSRAPSELDLALKFAAEIDMFPGLKQDAGIARELVSEGNASAWASRQDAIASLVRWFDASE